MLGQGVLELPSGRLDRLSVDVLGLGPAQQLEAGQMPGAVRGGRSRDRHAIDNGGLGDFDQRLRRVLGPQRGRLELGGRGLVPIGHRRWRIGC